jgi:hypothetical protein
MFGFGTATSCPSICLKRSYSADRFRSFATPMRYRRRDYRSPVLMQTDADDLLVMPKRLRGKGVLRADHGIEYRRDLDGIDSHETFVLDVDRRYRKVTQIKYQARARTTVVLARLDIDGPPHSNPGGQKIGGTHLHVYREGFDSRFAVPVNRAIFRDTTDAELTLVDFCRYIHVVGPTVPGTLRLLAAS